MEISTEMVIKYVSDLRKEAGEVISRLHDARGIVNILQELCKVIPLVVAKVEQVGKDMSLVGQDKKQLALDILMVLIKWPWWIPPMVRGALLNSAIEMVLSVFNRFWKK